MKTSPNVCRSHKKIS